MGKILLLVGTDANILYLLQRYAEESQFEPVRLSPDEDIVSVARRTKPAAIILEAEFVGGRKQDELNQLQESVATRSIPVLAYIRVDEEEIEPMAEVAGCLHDPVSYADFLAALGSVGVLPDAPSP